MVDIRRVRTVMTGADGSPYYSNHYFTFEEDGATDCVAAVHAFWDSLKTVIWFNLSIQVDNETVVLDDVTGAVISVEAGSAVTPVHGVNEGNLMPTAVQGLVSWKTGVYANGRQIRGRTFIPAPSIAQANSNGTVATAYVSAMQSAADGLVAASDAELVIWSKTHGQSAAVSNATAELQWATLRTRSERG